MHPSPWGPGCSSEAHEGVGKVEQELVSQYLRPLLNEAQARGYDIGLANDWTPNDVDFTIRASDYFHVRLIRTRHLSEGSNKFEMPTVNKRDVDFGAYCQEAIDHLTSLMDEDDVIREAGDKPDMPSGKFVRIEPLAGHILKASGLTIAEALEYRIKDRRPLQTDYGIKLAEVSRSENEVGVFTVPYLRNRHYLGSLTTTHNNKHALSLSRDIETFSLSLQDIHLPQTLVDSMAGQAVNDVISHPILEHAPRTIIKSACLSNGGALSNKNSLTVFLETNPITLEKAFA